MGCHVSAATIQAPPLAGGPRRHHSDQSVVSITRILFLTAWALLIALSPAAATAMTYYVAVTGNDANEGSETQPFRTLLKGVTALHPGDTLLVKNGTYTADWGYGLPAAGTSWDNAVTIKNYPRHTPVIRAVEGKHAVRFVGTQYVILDGFVIDATDGIDGVKVTSGTAYYEAHHIRIRNNEIMNAPGQGILGYGNYLEIINNTIHDNGISGHDHGIYSARQHVLIDGNDIYNNAGYGIHIYDTKTPGPALDNIIRNNRVHDNSRFYDYGSGILVGAGRGHIVYNNIVWNNAGGVQIAYGGAGDIKIFCNTIYANNVGRNNDGIVVSNAHDVIINNNIIYRQNGQAIYYMPVNADIAISNNLTTNPSFVSSDPKSPQDFKLLASSPAIDSGVTSPEVPRDFDGVSRPQGCCYDIGAYEHSARRKWAGHGTVHSGIQLLDNDVISGRCARTPFRDQMTGFPRQSGVAGAREVRSGWLPAPPQLPAVGRCAR